MIKKAPKDMTVDEFIDLVEKRYHTVEPTNMNAWINTLRMIAEEPAPNPFTPDQLAVLRELQRSGMSYAAMDEGGGIYFYKNEPHVDNLGDWLDDNAGCFDSCFSFLADALSDEDNPIIRFADYAPLDDDHV